MSYVSRLLMPIGKGKIQAKLHQERKKMYIYMIYIIFLSFCLLEKGFHFSDT